MPAPIPSLLAQLVTSPLLKNLKRPLIERYRVLKRRPHRVRVYLRINDPYSYLLLQVLAPLAQRYPLTYDFRTVLNLQSEMFPAPTLWDKNALRDGAYLAKLYDLKFPHLPPDSTPQRDAQFTAQLLHWELQPDYLANALPLFEAYWTANTADTPVDPRISNHVDCYQHHLQANENLLKNQGHYLSAMLHYGGEWYWGIDRLEHLERRLNSLNLHRANTLSEPREMVHFDRAHRDFCRQPALAPTAKAPASANQKAIEMFWSVRSPYSYIGLVRARQLATHYQLPLVVKPVLPMVMRRMQVPKAKGFYILQDAKREADKYGIPFGRVADPLGPGVERCYALYEFAQAENRGLDFLESYARGVWAEGIRSETDAGLQKLVERAGLDWLQAKEFLHNDSWRTWAQNNLIEIYGNDLWGVPSFTYGELKLFGQDRLGCLENAIIRERHGT
ncbi:DsbA family protein [Aestuariirhabdus sp. LZHN29]|uniref:DsbA family protein n=1 Tax=Aestuariirhabdus sp. LZHN29 TaxID=3417462 RepID=UPI003CF880BB